MGWLLLASSGWRPEIPLNTLQGTGGLPPRPPNKNHLAYMSIALSLRNPALASWITENLMYDYIFLAIQTQGTYRSIWYPAELAKH